MKQHAARGIFVSVLLSYCAVILINLIAFLFVAYRSTLTARDQAVETITMQLARGKDLVEARLEELEESAARIGGDPMIASFMRVAAPLRDVDYYSILQLSGQFERFNLRTSFVDSVYLVFRRSGAVLSTYFAGPDFEWLYPHFLKYGDLTYKEWLDSSQLWSGHRHFHEATDIHMNRRTVRAVTYIVPISYAATEPQAVLLAVLPELSISGCFEAILENGARLRLSDGEEGVLFDTGEVQPEPGFSVESQGHVTGLHYRVDVPASYLSRETQLVQAMFFAIVTAAIVAGLLVAVFFSLRNSRVLERVFGLLVHSGTVDPATDHLGYALVEKSLERLIGERIDIQEGVRRRRHFLRAGFFDRLLRGGFSEPEEVNTYLENLGIDTVPLPAMVVVVAAPPEDASINGQAGGHVGEVILHNVLRNRGNPSWVLHKTAEGEVLIVPESGSHVGDLVAALHELAEELAVPTTVAIGRPRATLFDLRDSFNEAVQALRTTVPDWTGVRVVRYELGDSATQAHHFGNQEEQQLIHAVSSGDAEQLKDLIAEIRHSNFDSPNLPTPAVESLFYDIAASVAKIMANADDNPPELPESPVRYLQRYVSADDFFRRLETVLLPICTMGCRRQESHTEVLARRISEYVSMRYADPMLSLESVAAEFELNHQYLSRFFKEHVGESFSHYLERIRLTAAEDLMRESETPTCAICTTVGYHSWNSFYKAFRRRYGISPGRFRAELTGAR